MYRHLLVPVDNTDLSIELVGNAVGLARAVGARITFFHAVAHHAGALLGNAAALHMTSADGPAHALAGQATELLAKAEAAARAVGVPCDSKHGVSDQPAAAIIEVARSSDCDLVLMASHGCSGQPGTTLASDTCSAVMNAGLPLLVSSVGDPGPSAHAIGIIRDEHRSLAAVLHAWMHVLATARSAGGAADPLLMRAAVRYLMAFVSTLHGPKEADHLFARLRERTSVVNAELDELQRRHARDRQRVADLAARVETLAAARGQAAVSATRDLDDAVRSYASFVWEHLGREEGVILPAAQRYLTEADWAAIDAVFVKDRGLSSDDEADAEVRQLLSRIVKAAQAAP